MIVICTDAWEPQVNGVVNTLKMTKRILEEVGHEVVVIHPGMFHSMPLPNYKEIRLSYSMGNFLKNYTGNVAFHIATEGPIGMAASKLLRKRNIPYTTSYHTNFDLYFNKYYCVPKKVVWWFIRRFHNRSKRIFVASERVKQMLVDNGITSEIVLWSRGVDITKFVPKPMPPTGKALYVGRVSVEKNIESFLELDIPFKKVVVGDGPDRKRLEKLYPSTEFLGCLGGDLLVNAYQNADVFVFPSKSDTFGLVIIEALACGKPVAAYPVQGPIDIITSPKIGCLDEDLWKAIHDAYNNHDPSTCVETAKKYSWYVCTQRFLTHLIFNNDE